MAHRVHPSARKVTTALHNAGYRVTSIIREDGSSHAKGSALDVADFIMKKPYTLKDAKKVFKVIRSVYAGPLSAISEQDHVHVDLDAKRPGIGTFDGYTITYASGDTMSNNYHEQGDATEDAMPPQNQTAATAVVLAKTVADKGNPRARHAAAKLAATPTVQKEAAMLEKMRDLLDTPVAWTFSRNAEVKIDSLGDLGPMRPADVLSLQVDMSSGMPVFTPRVFNATVIGADAYFFPQYQLGPSFAGPFPVGTRFKWAGMLMTLTVGLNFSRAGQPFTYDVVYGPGTQDVQSVTSLITDGTLGVDLSLIHGQIAGGRPRRNAPDLTVVAGAPNPLIDFPYVRITGLDFTSANPYRAVFRVFAPGDREIEKFLRYMG